MCQRLTTRGALRPLEQEMTEALIAQLPVPAGELVRQQVHEVNLVQRPSRGAEVNLSQKRLRSVLLCAGLCLALMAGACTQGPVTKADVVGIWVVDDFGKASPARTTLELKDDGTFLATALPADVVQTGDRTAVVDTSGRWRLSTRGDTHVIQMDFVLPDGQGGRKVWGNQLGFMGSGRSLVLFFTRGQPDGDDRVVFRRASAH